MYLLCKFLTISWSLMVTVFEQFAGKQSFRPVTTYWSLFWPSVLTENCIKTVKNLLQACKMRLPHFVTQQQAQAHRLPSSIILLKAVNENACSTETIVRVARNWLQNREKPEQVVCLNPVGFGIPRPIGISCKWWRGYPLQEPMAPDSSVDLTYYTLFL